MAAKKRKTLPKDFKELVESGDIGALKAVYDTCEIDAYDSASSKQTALHFYKVPDELVKWLVSQGADIEARDSYGRTPLHHQAGSWCGNVGLFLELGADIGAVGNSGGTPLHYAADGHHADSVRLLIEHGADLGAEENYFRHTPLAYALARCPNSGIAEMAQTAAVFLEAGDKITPKMKEDVRRIGETFEFHRENFNKDSLAETEAGLARLYEMFGVTPVARRRVHDGVSPITVSARNWQKQFSELWDFLVPSQGAAKTVQGEVIRIAGRVSDEILDNGGVNWDNDYRKMLDALAGYLGMGTPLKPREIKKAAGLCAKLQGGSGGAEPVQLAELAVRWVVKNPAPLPLGKPEYKR